jgi:hypothetical protein
MILVLNSFFLAPEEADRMRMLLRDSGCTVVWFYAPGLVTPERLDRSQMEALTGFRFSVIERPGSMMVKSALAPGRFGVAEDHFPRFVPAVEGAEVLGEWEDGAGPSFALKEYEGHTSVYVGTAPLPAAMLRTLAARAGARLWSSHEDIVFASHDAAMLVATEAGERSLKLPRPMRAAEGGALQQEHTLSMAYGDVRLFLAAP